MKTVYAAVERAQPPFTLGQRHEPCTYASATANSVNNFCRNLAPSRRSAFHCGHYSYAKVFIARFAMRFWINFAPKNIRLISKSSLFILLYYFCIFSIALFAKVPEKKNQKNIYL